jgi:hypothetical protein
MRRQLLVNATLVALALGTLGVVWATRDAPTTAALAARNNKLLPTWDEEAVTRIQLRRAGSELELVRDGTSNEFRITKPWAERADIAGVNALLGSLELASVLRPADVARGSAGLAPAQLEIRLEMAGKSRVVALGGPAPSPEGARYAEVTAEGENQRRFVVSQGVAAELDLPWDRFRETRLLEYGRSDFAKLLLESPSGRGELVPVGPGVFSWQAPTGLELVNPDTTERRRPTGSRSRGRCASASSISSITPSGTTAPPGHFQLSQQCRCHQSTSGTSATCSASERPALQPEHSSRVS